MSKGEIVRFVCSVSTIKSCMLEASKMPLKSSGLGENALKKSASFEALFVLQLLRYLFYLEW